MDELNNIKTKLLQDIEVLNARRSKLQNEIESSLKDAKLKIETERQVALADIEQKKKDLVDITEKANFYINNSKTTINARFTEVEQAEAILKKEQEKLNTDKQAFKTMIESENSRIQSEKNTVAKAYGDITKREDVIAIANLEIEDKKKEQDNRQFQVEYSQKQADKALAELSGQQALLNDILTKIRSEKETTISEQERTNIFLKEGKQVLTDNETLLKNIISERLRLAEDKQELNKKNEESRELLKQLAKEKSALEEEKISIAERNKLLVIDMRKNDEKIGIIERLRKELKTGV